MEEVSIRLKFDLRVSHRHPAPSQQTAAHMQVDWSMWQTGCQKDFVLYSTQHLAGFGSTDMRLPLYLARQQNYHCLRLEPRRQCNDWQSNHKSGIVGLYLCQ